jgi:hypothetical protein
MVGDLTYNGKRVQKHDWGSEKNAETYWEMGS